MTESSTAPTSQTGLRTFIAYLENKPGVLNRVTSLFTRRGYNIESLTVGQTENSEVSRLTVVLEADAVIARIIEANLYKLVNVLRVEDVTDAATVLRDLGLVKVRADAGARIELLKLCEVFSARVVDMTPETLVLEITGTEDKLTSFVDAVRPYGIVEMVRTGMVAMTRGSDAPTLNPDFVPAFVREG